MSSLPPLSSSSNALNRPRDAAPAAAFKLGRERTVAQQTRERPALRGRDAASPSGNTGSRPIISTLQDRLLSTKGSGSLHTGSGRGALTSTPPRVNSRASAKAPARSNGLSQELNGGLSMRRSGGTPPTVGTPTGGSDAARRAGMAGAPVPATSSSSSSASATATGAEASSSSSSSSSINFNNGGATVVLKCDKCDGKHATDSCPWFKKPRDKHPDAKRASEKKLMGINSGPVEILRGSAARVIRQPGDGSCLFHSMSYGLRDGSSAVTLRRQVAKFIEENPTLEISDSPLKDWIQWDTGSSVSAYARRMSQTGTWGGGIEMATVSHMKNVNVYVYQQTGAGFKRISMFEGPNARDKPVRVLYGGGVHYDALEVTG